MMSIGHTTPIYVPPLQPYFPIWYKLELTCEYHAYNPRHEIETCYAFKKWLLKLIKMGWVSFEDMPNINSNSFPNYAAGNNEVCMIEVRNKSKVFKVSIKKLYDMFVQSRFLKMNIECHLEVGDYCETSLWLIDNLKGGQH
jgi:hypothetical protein